MGSLLPENNVVEAYSSAIPWKQIEQQKRRFNEKLKQLAELSEDDEGYLIDTKLMFEAIGQLRLDCQKILTAFYYEQKKMSEIKQIFDLSSEQVARTKKYRCLNELIKFFEKKGVEYHQFFNDGA